VVGFCVFVGEIVVGTGTTEGVTRIVEVDGEGFAVLIFFRDVNGDGEGLLEIVKD
jgi:hypothetical protein